MNQQSSAHLNDETRGLILGFIGVVCFSLTLPATRAAVADLDPIIVGLGRALVGAVLAGAYLLIIRQPLPSRAQFKSLLVIGIGMVIGFPLCLSWAVQRVPASHGAIVLGFLPLATTVVGAIRSGERPSRAFWAASIIGSVLVVAFTLVTGGGSIQMADLALLGTVITGGIGYAEGGRLAREMSGARVISWSLLVAAPFLVVPVALAVHQHGVAASPGAWLGFAYISSVSAWSGFFAWYRGLALGGIARVSQLQLLQPFLTLFASALLLGEQITFVAIGFALAIVACVAIGRKAAIAR